MHSEQGSRWGCFCWLPNHWNSGTVVRRVCVAQLLQLCGTLCNPVDCSPPDSSAHGILQARMLEGVAMPSSRGSSPPRDWTHVSCSSCGGACSINLGSNIDRNLLFTFNGVIGRSLILSEPQLQNGDKTIYLSVTQRRSNEQAFLAAQMVKNLNAMWEIWVQSWVRENPRKGEWLFTPVLLPREFHRQKRTWRAIVTGLQRIRHNWVTDTFSFTFRGQRMSRLGLSIRHSGAVTVCWRA